MIGRLGRLRREALGLNRRNHEFLFAHNPRARWHTVDDKLVAKERLDAAGIAIPETLTVWRRPGELGGLRDRLLALGACVLKPARGRGGAGIIVADVVEHPGVRKRSGVLLPWPDVLTHAADVLAGVFSGGGREDVLMAERLVVAEATLAALAYRGVPDVRVVVFRGVPVMAMLRIPTRRSDGRANLHLGGIGAGVDLATGAVRPIEHPDLGRRIDGATVPAWDRVLTAACGAADAVGLGYVGVDLVVDATRGPLVLEVNARPGLAIQVVNQRGLRPMLDRVSHAMLPVPIDERVEFGRALFRATGS